ncbi:MAG TPA: 30S ribosomal protein S8 [Candidatus Aenigmarchaeota archaeon]|nr:30S ribosomal protein S8 [Candidatus Aenigmarchaeota archaeon]
MMRHDLLSDVLYVINNAENIGRKTVSVPASKLVKDVLMVIQRAGYIGSFEFVDDRKSGKFTIELVGKINKTRAVRPRFSIAKDEFEKWETRYLPAKSFGMLIISTSKGVMNQREAVELGIGGRLLGYVY